MIFCCAKHQLTQKKKVDQLEGHPSSKHPKHKQEKATTDMDLNNKGDLHKESPTTTTTKATTS